MTDGPRAFSRRDGDDQAYDSADTLVEFPTPDAASEHTQIAESPNEARDPSALRKAATWLSENRGTAVCAGLGAASLVVVASPTLVTAPLLGAAGLGAHGVAAGGVAASSAAGVGFGIIEGVLQAGAGIVAAGFGGGIVWKRWIGEKKKQEEQTPDKTANDAEAEGSARSPEVEGSGNTKGHDGNAPTRAQV